MKAAVWTTPSCFHPVSDEVCSYLLKRFPRDLNKLIELLDQLDKESLVQQKKVTVPFVKSVLNIS